MNKAAFLDGLRDRLGGLPPEELEERLSFYDEMIDDRVEDGLSEEEAVAGVGTVNEVAAQITAETPLSTLVRQRVRSKRRMKAWEIVLLVLCSPIWLSLLIAFFAAALSLYIVGWAVVISFFAVDLSLAVGLISGVISAVWSLVTGGAAAAGFLLGAGLLCGGLAILLYFGCLWLARAIVKLTGSMLLWMKTRLLRKETD